MELMTALVIGLHENEILKGKWPEGATECVQTSTYSVYFDEQVVPSSWRGEITLYRELELDNLPFIKEYDTGDTITKEQYEDFTAKNPNFYAELKAYQPEARVEMKGLNEKICAIITEMDKIADRAGIPLNINLGPYGSLDPNSDWDSSRC